MEIVPRQKSCDFQNLAGPHSTTAYPVATHNYFHFFHFLYLYTRDYPAIIYLYFKNFEIASKKKNGKIFPFLSPSNCQICRAAFLA